MITQVKSVVCCVFTRRVDGLSKLLVVQRRADQSFPLKWSIPGGKVESGERLHRAATREAREELSVLAMFKAEALTSRTFRDREHNMQWELHYMEAIDWAGDFKNLDGNDMRWISAATIHEIENDFLPDDLVVARWMLGIIAAIV